MYQACIFCSTRWGATSRSKRLQAAWEEAEEIARNAVALPDEPAQLPER